jgi:putrescine---pyruvate transaminase
MRDASALWHPFADMATLERPVVMERAEGVWVWDERGRRYLDGSAGLWYANVGHGRAEIARAVAAQLAWIETHHVFNDYATRPAIALAERLSALAPTPGSKVFLVSGGGDAIDTAAKLARLHWAARGEPRRVHIVSRGGGYHGTHGFGTSLAGIPSNQEGYGPLVADVGAIPYDSVDALAAEIAGRGPERIAAFLFEPVIASGGVLAPPDGYLEGVAALCREHGILLIADAVVCGFGRLGTWFGVERWGIEPDLIAFAKGVTSGYLPLGGVIAAPTVADAFWRPGGPSFRHGPTYSGHATCCAAALANLDIIEREELLARSRELEQPLRGELEQLGDHPLVESVRAGVGLLGAFDLPAAVLARHPDAVLSALLLARASGVLTRPLERGLAVSPPLTIAREELALIGDCLRRGLDALGELLDEAQPSPLGPAAVAAFAERRELHGMPAADRAGR